MTETITHHAAVTVADQDLELWTRGNAELLEQIPAGIAVAGSRAATAYGGEVAASYAAELTQHGHLVITSGSSGIDVSATRGVLAAGGAPVVVLPCGLDRTYPVANADLFEAVIAAGGLLVSFMAPGVAPTRTRFVERSAWIGATSAATVVIEAGTRSAALTVAEAAASHGRAVAAVPGPVTSHASHGTHRLIEQGAEIVYDTASLLTFAHDAKEARGL